MIELHLQRKRELEYQLRTEKIKFIREVEPLKLFEYCLGRSPNDKEIEVIGRLNVFSNTIINCMLYYTFEETNFFRYLDGQVKFDDNDLNMFVKLGDYLYGFSPEEKYEVSLDLQNPHMGMLHDYIMAFINAEIAKQIKNNMSY